LIVLETKKDKNFKIIIWIFEGKWVKNVHILKYW
jgi:hypothetical protein